MKWRFPSQARLYLSVGLTLMGLSAASTLLTSPPSMAQSPAQQNRLQSQIERSETAVLDAEVGRLTAEQTAALQELGNDHPRVRQLQAQMEALRKQIAELRASEIGKNAAQAAVVAAQVARGSGRMQPKAVEVRNLDAGPSRVVEVQGGDVLTENIRGGQDKRVIVRQTADGNTLTEVTPLLPAQVTTSFYSPINSKQAKELQEAVEKLKSSDAGEQDKATAREKISGILAEQFDEDLQQRTKQVEQLEQQVASLKKQIEKRKTAKDRLIELRIELLINESEGLGFPNAWQNVTRSAQTLYGPYTAPQPAQVYRGVMSTVPMVSGLPPAPPVPPTPPAAAAPPTPAAPDEASNSPEKR